MLLFTQSMYFFMTIFLNEQLADPHCYSALYIVGSIKTIQAIVPENSFLALDYLIAFDLVAVEP